jgi:hypothetical protein
LFQKLYRGHRGRVRAHVFKIRAAKRRRAINDCLSIIPLIGRTSKIVDLIGSVDCYGVCARCFDCSKFKSRGSSGSKKHICACGHYVRNHVKDYYLPNYKKEIEPMQRKFYINVGFISEADFQKVKQTNISIDTSYVYLFITILVSPYPPTKNDKVGKAFTSIDI